MMTEKQARFIEFLVDKIGFRNSPKRKEYITAVYNNCDTFEATTRTIDRLVAENELRKSPKLKGRHNTHIAITDLSAFTFCPASYVIAETFDTLETEQVHEGKELHNKKYLQNFLNNLRNKRTRQAKEKQLTSPTADRFVYRGSYGDLLASSLSFVGHDQRKKQSFRNSNGTLVGIPDYVFTRPDNVKFVVEEKHTWRERDLTSPFPNHIAQALGYIYALDSLQLSYGYVIYFHWTWFKGSLSTSKVSLFKVTQSNISRINLLETYKRVRHLKDGHKMEFDPTTLNVQKCFRCSVSALCVHKDGRHKVLQYPYSLGLEKRPGVVAAKR